MTIELLLEKRPRCYAPSPDRTLFSFELGREGISGVVVDETKEREAEVGTGRN